MKCPKCGSTEQFEISATMAVIAKVDGDEDCHDWEPGDIEWTNCSWAACGACGFDGEVNDFQEE